MIPPNIQLHGLKWGHTNSRTFSEAFLPAPLSVFRFTRSRRQYLLQLSSQDPSRKKRLMHIAGRSDGGYTWNPHEHHPKALPVLWGHCLLQKQFTPLLKLPNPSLSPKKNRCKLLHLTELLGTSVVPSVCAFSLVNLSRSWDSMTLTPFYAPWWEES